MLLPCCHTTYKYQLVLNIEHWSLAMKAGYQTGEKPITATLVESVTDAHAAWLPAEGHGGAV